MISFFLIPRVTILTIRAMEDTLNTLLTITAQLFGFGGVIFAVLYTEQRKMIGQHRAATNQVYHEIKDEDTTAPAHLKIPSSKQRLAQIKTHLEPYVEGIRIYLEGRKMFSLGFLALGLGFVLQLIQRVGFSTLAKISFFPNAFLLSIDIALIAVGISSLIAALLRSLSLPLGTNDEANLLGEMKGFRQKMDSLIDKLEKLEK
jgi:hypothetical protein